jgi:hypothetical protein
MLRITKFSQGESKLLELEGEKQRTILLLPSLLAFPFDFHPEPGFSYPKRTDAMGEMSLICKLAWRFQNLLLRLSKGERNWIQAD